MNKRQRKKYLKKLRRTSMFNFAEVLGFEVTDWQIKVMEILNREIKSKKFGEILVQAHEVYALNGHSFDNIIIDDSFTFKFEPVLTEKEIERVRASVPPLRIY